MQQIVNKLKDNPIINIILAIVYYLLVVLPHEQVGLFTVKVFGHLPRDRYDFIILVSGIVILLLFIIPLLKGISKQANQTKLLISLAFSILCSVIIFHTLIIINIEIVHFFQYGMMAILLFPLIRHYGQTLFWVMILGSLDEAYQYFYLSPDRTDYYDFNDVIINQIGGTFGLIALKAFGVKEVEKSWKGIFIFLIAVSSLSILLWFAGYLDIYPGSDESFATIQLIKKYEPGFWSVVHPNITYHIVRPLEGILIVGFLMMVYSVMLRGNT